MQYIKECCNFSESYFRSLTQE